MHDYCSSSIYYFSFKKRRTGGLMWVFCKTDGGCFVKKEYKNIIYIKYSV